MSDWNNDYSHAGKGFKARQRARLIPKKISKPKPYQQKPEYEKRKAKREEMSEAYHTAIGVKARIRLLVIDRDASYLDLMDVMKREGVSVSGVAVGNVRAEMREIMKLLEKEGLLNTDALTRRRKRLKA